MTPREAAALQGFPDTFVFYGAQFASQIGNAVPPPLAYAIATALKKVLTQAPQSLHGDQALNTLDPLLVEA